MKSAELKELNYQFKTNNNMRTKFANLLKSALLIGAVMCCFSCQKSKKVEIISEVIEKAEDYSRMPSYCNPKAYKIAKCKGRYGIVYPSGTIWGEYFNTIEDAQIEINKKSSESKKRWLDSGGVDY
jgi:hypothetical protein